jgi:hypothetical protein
MSQRFECSRYPRTRPRESVSGQILRPSAPGFRSSLSRRRRAFRPRPCRRSQAPAPRSSVPWTARRDSGSPNRREDGNGYGYGCAPSDHSTSTDAVAAARWVGSGSGLAMVAPLARLGHGQTARNRLPRSHDCHTAGDGTPRGCGMAAAAPAPHRLRHGWVTVALDAGVVLHVAQDGAGHADPRTTQRYNSKRHSLDKAAAYTVAAYIGTIASPPRLPRRRHYRAAQPRPKRASGWAPDSGRGAGERPRALEGRTHGSGRRRTTATPGSVSPSKGATSRCATRASA